MKLYLEQTGRFDVCEENHGAHALATARLFRPDLVLLDVIMPDMDGGSVAAQLKHDELLQHVPIVFLTAIVSKEETGTQMKVIGGNPFLAKPESMDVITACIERELAKAGTLSHAASGR